MLICEKEGAYLSPLPLPLPLPFSLSRPLPHVPCSYPAASANIQEAAPGFKAKAVVDGDIVDVSTDDYKGKWLVLLFYPKVILVCFQMCRRSADVPLDTIS